MSAKNSYAEEQEEFIRYCMRLSEKLKKLFAKKKDRILGNEKSVKGPLAQLIWQYVRMNPAYRKAYDRLVSSDPDELSMKWLMSNHVHPDVLELPSSCRFLQPRAVFTYLEKEHREKNISLEAFIHMTRAMIQIQNSSIGGRWGDVPSLIVVVNPLASRDVIIEEIDNALNKSVKPCISSGAHPGSIRGSQLRLYLEYFVCYVFLNHFKLENKIAADYFSAIFGAASLKPEHYRNKAKKFKEIVKKSPQIFLMNSTQ